MKTILFFLSLTLLASGSDFTLRGYGLADPERHSVAIQRQAAAERAAELDLRRLFLYYNGCRIRKISGGYAIADSGVFREAPEIRFKQISPVFSEASFEAAFPAHLSQRPTKTIPFEITYAGELQIKNFASAQKYLAFMEDILVKTLGDHLTKQGLFRGDNYIELDFLPIDRSWGRKKVKGVIHYLVQR